MRSEFIGDCLLRCVLFVAFDVAAATAYKYAIVVDPCGAKSTPPQDMQCCCCCADRDDFKARYNLMCLRVGNTARCHLLHPAPQTSPHDDDTDYDDNIDVHIDSIDARWRLSAKVYVYCHRSHCDRIRSSKSCVTRAAVVYMAVFVGHIICTHAESIWGRRFGPVADMDKM